MDDKIIKLRDLLQTSISKLTGDFVSKRSGYDSEICILIEGFRLEETRHYDCTWGSGNLNIEFKKGTNIWLDLVRYSEVLLLNSNTDMATYTLFFIPDITKRSIKEIIGVDTRKIIEKVGLTIDEAILIRKIHEKVLRNLNAQANLTVRDVKTIADFIVQLA